MKNIINNLLASGKAEKHHTYDFSGIVCVNLKKISGSCGRDVDHAYIFPYGKIDVCYENVHYGYAHFIDEENLIIEDNSHRSVFQIIDWKE